MVRALLGLAVGLLARVWLATLRVSSSVHPALGDRAHVPWTLALWHGQIFPLLAFHRRRRTVAMVSLSADGDILTWAFKVLGVGAARGSSSRDGRRALDSIVALMASGWDGAFAVDGPRGPSHVPHTGALVAAGNAHGVVVPFVAACERSMRLTTSWDQFEIPLPFSRVAVVLGAPLLPQCAQHAHASEVLTLALDEACELARCALANAHRSGPCVAPLENA